jgi:hypothetical protein
MIILEFIAGLVLAVDMIAIDQIKRGLISE